MFAKLTLNQVWSSDVDTLDKQWDTLAQTV